MINRLLPYLCLCAVLLLGAAHLDGIYGSGSVPAGAIVMVASGSCPATFSEVTGARGRAIVGTPNSGTVGGTMGTAMGNLEARFMYIKSTGGSINSVNGGIMNTTAACNTTNTCSWELQNSLGTPVNTTTLNEAALPYLQVLLCSKN